MAVQPLSSDQIRALVGTRHAATGIEYPPSGLQPYYEWLVQTLHLLAEASAGPFRVAEDDATPMSVRIAPGRASIAGVVLAYAGEVKDLSAYNNDTAYLWLADDAGNAKVGVASSNDGWPGQDHIKLAEVTLAGGEISGMLDRRFETIFRV